MKKTTIKTKVINELYSQFKFKTFKEQDVLDAYNKVTGNSSKSISCSLTNRGSKYFCRPSKHEPSYIIKITRNTYALMMHHWWKNDLQNLIDSIPRFVELAAK